MKEYIIKCKDIDYKANILSLYSQSISLELQRLYKIKLSRRALLIFLIFAFFHIAHGLCDHHG